MTQEDMRRILELGASLSSERDLERLLERILDCAVDLAHCDGGTLYLLEDNVLRFRLMRNDSMGTHLRSPDLPPVPLNRENVCAMALLENRPVVIDDVYSCLGYDLSGPMRYDALNGYRTVSMLAVPMVSREGEPIGALQLINALDDGGKPVPFAPEMVLLVESAASQAGVTIQNVRYMAQIRELFHSIVRVLSAAIDERTPYNASHSRHMAEYAARFMDWRNAQAGPDDAPFDSARREELLMSIWLHDAGKLATPLEVMNKENRLLPAQRVEIGHRLEVIRLLGEIDALAGHITAEERDALIEQTAQAEALVDKADRDGLWDTPDRVALDALAERTYTDQDGLPHPWLTPEEHRMLSIQKGTLSPEEREIMERHVVLTDRFLSEIRFSPELSHVRPWAAAHHELLDGSGYPKHLTADQIPPEVRLITILDVFDALVASDRPYKPGKPVAVALKILQSMAEEGQLDPDLVTQFAASRCWDPPAEV